MNRNYIKCKCGKENYIQAKYCAYCGTELPKEDRDNAYYKTPFGFIDKMKSKESKVKEVYKILNDPISVITSKKIVKIVLIFFFIIASIYLSSVRPKWDKVVIIPTQDYNVEYNQNIYEIETDKDVIELKLVCLKEIKNAEIDIPLKDNALELDSLKEGESNLMIKTTKGIEHKLNIIFQDDSKGNIRFIFK